MGGFHLVRTVRGDRSGEGGLPRLCEFARLRQRQRGHERGERLVQPQAIPPVHRHQIAEPHVRHLVEQHTRMGAAVLPCDRTAPDVALVEGDRRDILHGSPVEVRHKQLIVFTERERQVEVVLEELESLAGESEPRFRVDVVRQRLPCEQPQRYLPGLRFPHAVVARMQRVDVGADGQRGRKRPGFLVTGLGDVRFCGDRHHHPVGGRRDLRGVPGLQIRLVEGGKQAVLVEGLEVGKHIDATILGVDETIQPGAVGAVGAREPHHCLVAPAHQGAARQRQVMAVVTTVRLGAIDDDRHHGTASEIESQIARRIGEIERDPHAARVLGSDPVQSHGELVAEVADPVTAGARLLHRQHRTGLLCHGLRRNQRREDQQRCRQERLHVTAAYGPGVVTRCFHRSQARRKSLPADSSASSR